MDEQILDREGRALILSQSVINGLVEEDADFGLNMSLTLLSKELQYSRDALPWV